MSPKMRLEDTPIVRLPTSSGPSHIQTVIGKRSVVSDDIEEFRGIPYAQIPGRWEHSRLRDRLPRDVFDATENGPRCPRAKGIGGDTKLFQVYLPFPDTRQDEFECLNLFVVRPSKEALAKHNIDPVETTELPVLIWIHGGGFVEGAGTDPVWDPARLVLRALSNKTPFIGVFINYRLGIFGFGGSSDVIATQGNDTPTRGLNFGLYDQKLAFTWVQNNIAAFGGDNTKITIMGHSAGGISCYLHLLQAESSNEKPLFRKAGVLSGPAGCLDLASLEKVDERWSDICRLWSVEAENPVDRVNMLKRIPARDLLNGVSEINWNLFAMVIDEMTIRKSDLRCGVSVHLGHEEKDDEATTSFDEKVQVMICAANEEFRDFTRITNWDYKTFYSLFVPCFPSVEAAEEVLQTYGILPTLSDEKTLEAISWLISDSTMMLKLHRGYDFLKTYRRKQALLHGHDSQHVGLQYHHFEFGNPFLGPLQGAAHHGVELIYAFGNFHDALKQADQGILRGYDDPDAAQSEANVDELTPSVNTKVTEYCKSNIDLSHELQDTWIRFVVEDCLNTDRRANADDITTFCADRSVRIESWDHDEKWLARRKRIEILGNNFDSMTTATRKLFGSVLGISL